MDGERPFGRGERRAQRHFTQPRNRAGGDGAPEGRQKALGFGFVALLSFLAGMTDAIGFLRAGDFLSFMSGNTTRLAIAIGEGRGDAVMRLASILGIFVVGNATGVIVVRATGERQWPLLMAVTVVTGSVAAFAGASPSPFTYLPLVLAMGMLNAAVDNVAGHPLGLTYVTGALSRFGKGLGRFICGERRPGFLVQMCPWVGMLSGAVTGVLLLHSWQETSIWALGALALALTAISLSVPHAWMHPSFGLGRPPD
ncbi:YoaK family protein [Jiella sonneratiae]|uniref:DUF1275 domain-containing protein n=1 Tax=Jiella sonneratiae TaxID=2816856 RepID=A0ABS3J6M5_9HYPH|nr:YoaK family protein [Jiella sonneratiae]MBO0905319.1 DUF1275 domain-containing protein [Jiella sonneratiae]